MHICSMYTRLFTHANKHTNFPFLQKAKYCVRFPTINRIQSICFLSAFLVLRHLLRSLCRYRSCRHLLQSTSELTRAEAALVALSSSSSFTSIHNEASFFILRSYNYLLYRFFFAAVAARIINFSYAFLFVNKVGMQALTESTKLDAFVNVYFFLFPLCLFFHFIVIHTQRTQHYHKIIIQISNKFPHLIGHIDVCVQTLHFLIGLPTSQLYAFHFKFNTESAQCCFCEHPSTKANWSVNSYE